MDHALLMGVVNGVADSREQLEATTDAEAIRAHELPQRRPANQFHDEVGLGAVVTVFSAGLEHLSDAGVAEVTENLRLVLEPAEGLRRCPTQVQHLQRDRSARVFLDRLVHDAHAAAPEFTGDFIRTQSCEPVPRCGPESAFDHSANRRQDADVARNVFEAVLA